MTSWNDSATRICCPVMWPPGSKTWNCLSFQYPVQTKGKAAHFSCSISMTMIQRTSDITQSSCEGILLLSMKNGINSVAWDWFPDVEETLTIQGITSARSFRYLLSIFRAPACCKVISFVCSLGWELLYAFLKRPAFPRACSPCFLLNFYCNFVSLSSRFTRWECFLYFKTL